MAPQINLSPTKDQAKLNKRMIVIKKTKIIPIKNPKTPVKKTRIVIFFDLQKTKGTSTCLAGNRRFALTNLIFLIFVRLTSVFKYNLHIFVLIALL